MNEADRHELENDWDWEPPGIRGPVVLEVRKVDTPLMTREEAEAESAGEYLKSKREIVEYLQQVASKTLVWDWKLTGSVDATMRRTSREHLVDAVEAVQKERDQPFATVKQRKQYGQNDQDQDEEDWEEPLVEEANSSSSSGTSSITCKLRSVRKRSHRTVFPPVSCRFHHSFSPPSHKSLWYRASVR